jgi:hypothetical protein
MRTIRDRRAVLSVVAALGAGVLLVPAAAQQPQGLEARFTYYYQDPRPERLVGFFDEYQKLPAAQQPGAYPPVAGFFAVIFRGHPERIDTLVPAQLSPKSTEAVAAALRLSGNQAAADKFQARLKAIGHDEQLATAFAGLPAKLEDLKITAPYHLDILWGAAFASGDGKFVVMIIDYFARTANRSEAVALDIGHTVIAMSGGSQEILGELRGRYGDDGARQIIYAATALWAVASNARQHAFVNKVVGQYIDAHPGTPAQKALAALRPKPPS